MAQLNTIFRAHSRELVDATHTFRLTDIQVPLEFSLQTDCRGEPFIIGVPSESLPSTYGQKKAIRSHIGILFPKSRGGWCCGQIGERLFPLTLGSNLGVGNTVAYPLTPKMAFFSQGMKNSIFRLSLPDPAGTQAQIHVTPAGPPRKWVLIVGGWVGLPRTRDGSGPVKGQDRRGHQA